MQDKISLAGDLGGGKSTVANILIDRLGAEHYSTGALVRPIASSRGVPTMKLTQALLRFPRMRDSLS